jgi:hypothetical protein
MSTRDPTFAEGPTILQRIGTMRNLLIISGLALLLAAPAMAQSVPQTNAAPTNGYAEQAARILAEEAQLPAGGDERVRADLDWQALVAKANADRVGTPINLGAIRAQVQQNAQLRSGQYGG